MKFVYKRRTKKLKRLKFCCTRCGCKFIADLIPDCDYQYSEYLSQNEKDFIQGYVRIRTICPDCGNVVLYGKHIDLYKNGTVLK